MPDKETVILHIESVEDTPASAKAWLVNFEDGAQVWIPKSISTLDEQACAIEVESWFVEKEDLEEYAK